MPATQTFTRRRIHAPFNLAVGVVNILRWFHEQADQRQPRPWLGSVGIALAVSAALLTELYVALPFLALCAWWWCPRMRFGWVLPLGAGVLGTAWVTVGLGLIALLPLSLAGPVWAWIAAILATSSALARAATKDRFG
jgi:hypothetical protein